ncbi:pol II transcription elongation factor [Coprinopsis marcescibilis]|uniref:Elongator complex protein 1 n=1 Tax=Coprinopsis marcescibilis TaxID=230819 RepID=A0A5C3KZH2_COPMA|nr:pol II transcription elongation factor [Coprinopsis marcescibilis]
MKSKLMTSMFSATASAAFPRVPQIVSLRVVAETRQVVAVMAGGDIVVITIDEEDSPSEVEGTFETGISAAAWSPDDSLLAIVTGERKLILMTSSFDVLSEGSLRPVEFGEDAPINVGWGSKQTQFHGSLGKIAAQAPKSVKVGSSPDDDNAPRISWRGDGTYFVVSSLSDQDEHGLKQRTLRVYDRNGSLQSTSEPVPGLEHTLSWRPSGNLIVGTQRFGGFEGSGAGKEGRHDIVFFERNGLRHGEFALTPDSFLQKDGSTSTVDLRWGYRVRDLSWNSDSNILAVWAETTLGDIVQLWTIGNYHWYLKHEILAPSPSDNVGRFTSLQWHPEVPSHIILTTSSEIIQRHYELETFISPSLPPNDTGLVAVLDGSQILLTPFRTQNVPPPMSSFQLPINLAAPTNPSKYKTKTPIHVSFTQANDGLAMLWEDGYIQLWVLHTRKGPGFGKVMNPEMIWEGAVPVARGSQWRQITAHAPDSTDDSWTIGALGNLLSADVDTAIFLTIKERKHNHTETITLPSKNCRIVDSVWPPLYQTPEGRVIRHDHEGTPTENVGQFPEFCAHMQVASAQLKGSDEKRSLFVGLGKSGKLYVSSGPDSWSILASNTNSFTVASGFVIFATTAHESKYAPVEEIASLLAAGNEGPLKDVPDKWVVRKLERGSRIVVAVPSTMSLVLQMPRGNLETVNPRPLVMQVAKQDLDAGEYRKAFMACRKHRIDFNELVDHDQEAFLRGIPHFVEQIPEVDYLNLFLTMIGRGPQSAETVTKICDALRVELESRDLKRYINTILTAHVVKSPPDYESALAELHRLRETDSTVVEEAVKYVIFLVDAEKLFDIALGMYDFSLVLMIAQHAQKDPREYLPFLRELRSLDKYYQRFRIDDHLKRYESALKNLSLAGPERFEEAFKYIERYSLYEPALKIWRGTDKYNDVLDLYGDWLYERRELPQSAAAFIEAKKPEKAMVAYEKNLQWQELFDLALEIGSKKEDLETMAYRVAEDLSSKKRYLEAGRVLLDYGQDIKEAVSYLCQGNDFSEARRVSNFYKHPELVEGVVRPMSLESRAQISDDLGEMKEQLRKQRERIRELRIKKVEEPDAFYGTEDVTLQNIDVMTDVSMAPTAFTRYTIAPSTASRVSKRSSRSKRKAERKVSSGRKGTVDEEEYILKSLTKLAARFASSRDDARRLLPHLFRFSDEYRQEGLELQQEVAQFETELKEALEEIWAKPLVEDEDGPLPDSWAARMAEAEKNRQINPIDRVPKPDTLRNDKWRIDLYEI